MGCEVDRFGDIIEDQKENLKYLQQLETTFAAHKAGETNKFKALLIDQLGGLFEDQISDLFGDGVSFDALVGALQFLAIANPAALGVAAGKEISKLEKFFRGEKKKLDAVAAQVGEMIDMLNTDWSGLSDYEEFRKQHREGLNDYYNHRVPRALRHINDGKVNLITAETMLYTTNVLEDDTSFMGQLHSAQTSFFNAKNQLLDSPQQNFLQVLADFLDMWDRLKESIGLLTDVDSEEWEGMEDIFNKVGEDLASFFEALRSAIRTVATTMREADSIAENIQDTWALTHASVVRNQDTDTQSRIYGPVWSALDRFIQTSIPTQTMVPAPDIGLPVSNETFSLWESQANANKPLQLLWYNRIEQLETAMNDVTTGPTADALSNLNTIYSPLTDALITLYKHASQPFWRELFRLVAVLQQIVDAMMEGKAVQGNLVALFVTVQAQMDGIATAANNMVNYFDTENPLAALHSAMGITQQTQALFGGFSALADSLGLDYLSNMIDQGDFVEALSLTEKTANTTQQLLNCLEATAAEEGTAEYQGTALEIQKVAVAEKMRKEKLKNTFDKAIKDGVKHQEEVINHYEELLERYEEGPVPV